MVVPTPNLMDDKLSVSPKYIRCLVGQSLLFKRIGRR